MLFVWLFEIRSLFWEGGIRDDLLGDLKKINFGCSPFPLTVTTRIITFVVGNPNLNLHLTTGILGGGHTQNKLDK